jgi:3-hydroxyisobutyrate dehydrogenase
MATIAFLGTGTMGMPMARNLADAGFPVRAWNRSPERAEPLADAGVEICGNPAQAADGATVLITMLSDAASVLDCAADAVRSLEPGSIWIQMSTIGVSGIQHCMELADRSNVQLIDAPVLGTKGPAEQGELVVLASGSQEALNACDRIFDVVGSKTVRFGDAGDGTRGKLVANNWMLGLTAVLGESITLAQSLDIDPRAFLTAIADGPVDSPYAHIKGKKMIERDFTEASFKLDLARKDAHLALTEARDEALSVPILHAVADSLDQASRSGHGDHDVSALAASALGAEPVGLTANVLGK